MADITSTNNRMIVETVKLHQKKYRNSSGLFLLEGKKSIEEAFKAGVDIQTVFVKEENAGKFSYLKEKIKTVNDAVIKKLSTTDSPPEIAAVARQVWSTIEDIKSQHKIVLLENIKDAGNLGTIIRSAAAFKMDAIILCGDCIDLYNPKVVRSTAGNLFKLPVVKTDSIKQIAEHAGNRTYIATVVNYSRAVPPEKLDFTKPFVLMLGSEADGLTKDAVKISDVKTTIKISSKVESLNLSIAASVLFYIAGMNSQVL